MGKETVFELLEGGKAAFPEIIRQIRAAEHEITVHMVIWREDGIGTEIAREIIAAADRGVKVTIEDELAVAVDNDDGPFAAEIRSSVEKAFRNSEAVSARSRISYDPILAALETAMM